MGYQPGVWLTQRTIYDADRNLRKGVALDETLPPIKSPPARCDRPAGPDSASSAHPSRCSPPSWQVTCCGCQVRVPGQRGVRQPDQTTRKPSRRALRLLRSATDIRLLRGDARDARRGPGDDRPTTPASSSSPTATRGVEDPHRPGGPAPGARHGTRWFPTRTYRPRDRA
ncbi:hypothetical protein HBB16_01345 [Pseudonocardia sp. MCCB 268]|nr:hypothetical protein [Pseudonocardia cytotoxica]